MMRRIGARLAAVLCAVAPCGLITDSAAGETTIQGLDGTGPKLSFSRSSGTVTRMPVNGVDNAALFYIQDLPGDTGDLNDRLVTSITVEDISYTSGEPACATAPYELVVKKMEQNSPPGHGGSAAEVASDIGWITSSRELLPPPSNPGQVTWEVDPFYLEEDHAYDIRIDVNRTYCSSAEIGAWPHSQPRINHGGVRCEQAYRPKYSGYYRMWHTEGQSDRVACGGAAGVKPAPFAADMPSGWLLVKPDSETPTVITRDKSDTRACDLANYSVEKADWRATNNKKVCVWTRYKALSQPEPTLGWFNGFGISDHGTGNYDNPQDVGISFNTDEAELAERYKPSLFFDSSESWRPLDVDSFFSETVNGQAAHSVCQSGGSVCTLVTDPSQLSSSYPDTAYIDVNGDPGTSTTYKSTFAECLTEVSNEVFDCNAGPRSAIYWHMFDPANDGTTPASETNYTEFSGYKFVQYWMFYRFNEYSAGPAEAANHEGDWESFAVAPSVTDPGSFDFASFSQHKDYFSYLRGALTCTDTWLPNYAGSCGEDPEKYGSQVAVKVANGSHANYANSCSEAIAFVSCKQNHCAAGACLPERGYDGAVGWGHNGYEQPNGPYTSDGLREFPSTEDWYSFAGRWGELEDTTDGPNSPANNPYWGQPWDACAQPYMEGDDYYDNSQCELPGLDQNARRRGSSAAPQGGPCRAWQAPTLAFSACDPQALSRALRSGRLGAPGDLELAGVRTGARVGRPFGTAPGVAQLNGPALSNAEEVVVAFDDEFSGRLTVALPTERPRRVARYAEFRGVDAAAGDQLTVEVDRGDASAVLEGDGESLAGAIERADVESP